MFSATLLCITLLAAGPIESTARWEGRVADKSLQSAAPDGGYLADAESLARVWRAWRSDEAPPRVDFAKELILVGVAPGPNQVEMRPSLDEQGDLRWDVVATEKAGPGFGYLLLKVGRDGVKTVQGRPLAAPRSPMVVSVRVLFGADAAPAKSEVEPWIAREAAKLGVKHVAPQTGWRKLTKDEQRIYTSPNGGFYIDGLLLERNGRLEASFDGCAGAAVEETVILNSGDRLVVRFASSTAPDNVFLAIAVDGGADSAARRK